MPPNEGSCDRCAESTGEPVYRYADPRYLASLTAEQRRDRLTRPVERYACGTYLDLHPSCAEEMDGQLRAEAAQGPMEAGE